LLLAAKTHSVAGNFEFRKDPVEEVNFSGSTNKILVNWPIPLIVKEIRVIANFSQLHERVHEAFVPSFTVISIVSASISIAAQLTLDRSLLYG
jgi:hypothetical protein